MRQRKQEQRGKKPKKKTEPLAEGIIPLDKRGRRLWSSMSDDKLVEYAHGVVDEKQVKSRNGLKKADYGLYQVLRKRKLLDRFGLEKRRDWASMSDDEIVGYACGFVREKGLKNRTNLSKADPRLYDVLRRRKLLDSVIPRSFHAKSRNWRSMSDDEVVEYARRVIDENGLESRTDLERMDQGLDSTLRRRKLLDAIFPDSGQVRRRNWSSMSDDEIVAYAQEFMREKKIKGRRKLYKADSGLYEVLRKRGLFESVGLENKNANFKEWSGMSDEQIVEYAQGYLRENEIFGREDLKRVYSGMLSVLRKRNLLDRVFSSIESDQQKQAVQDVVDAMKEFET